MVREMRRCVRARALTSFRCAGALAEALLTDQHAGGAGDMVGRVLHNSTVLYAGGRTRAGPGTSVPDCRVVLPACLLQWRPPTLLTTRRVAARVWG